MTVFGLPHLSEDAVAAYADGVLAGAAATRAAKHTAECTECAEAVRTQRETALWLRTAGTPAIPAGLMDRLAGVPDSTPLPPPHSGLPTALGPDGRPVFVAHQPPAKRPEQEFTAQPRTQPNPHPHRRLLMPLGIVASAAVVVTAGAIGSSTSGAPSGPVRQQPASVRQAVSEQSASQPPGPVSTGQPAFSPAGSPLQPPLRPVLATSPRPRRS